MPSITKSLVDRSRRVIAAANELEPPGDEAAREDYAYLRSGGVGGEVWARLSAVLDEVLRERAAVLSRQQRMLAAESPTPAIVALLELVEEERSAE